MLALAVVTCPWLLAADKKPATLDGVWRGFVVEGKGERPEQGRVHVELTIKGDHIVAKQIQPAGDQGLGEGTYQVTSGDPNLIDATRTSNPGKGQAYKGIIQVDGETMKWCAANPGKERPKEFETRPPVQFFMILKRESK